MPWKIEMNNIFEATLQSEKNLVCIVIFSVFPEFNTSHRQVSELKFLQSSVYCIIVY